MICRWCPGFLGAALLGSAVLVAAPREERRESRTVPLASGANLRVQNRNGRIEVEAWDREELAIQAEILDSPERRANLTVRGQGRDLQVEVQAGERGWMGLISPGAPRCNLVLKVPRHLNGAFHTLNGDIQVTGLDGFAECTTTNGDIRLAGVRGEAHCETTNGSIEARGLKARLKGETTHGSIRVSEVEGGLKLETTHGNIRAENLDGWGEGICLETTHGDIDVLLGKATGEILAENTLGGLDVRPADARAEVLESGSHEIRVRVPGRSQQIRLETTHGSIRVR